MKRIILFAMAASLALSAATAATTSKAKPPKAQRAAAVKPPVLMGDKEKGYAAGYAVKFDDKSDPFSVKVTGTSDYREGYMNGLKQHAMDEGMKVGQKIDEGFDYSKIPNWKKSQKACEYWVEGYNVMFNAALAGWNAGLAAIETEGDNCKSVPAKYAAQSDLYKNHYKKAHKVARKIYANYIKAYKEGYASSTPPDPYMEGDGAPRRTDPNRDWYTAMFEDLCSSVNLSFSAATEYCFEKYNPAKGAVAGYEDKKAGKKPRF